MRSRPLPSLSPLAPTLLAAGLLLPAALAAQQITYTDSPLPDGDACTSVMVSKGASVDGSVFITYSADAPFMPKLLRHPGGGHTAGELVEVVAWENDEVRGPVKQVAHTHAVVGLMNEHQLALGETTTGGRAELRDPDGLLDYDALMWLTLQRASTAREAIHTIEALAAEYGYASSGESIAIADPDEAWVMEILARGPEQKGIVWVAARVPDGCISVSANMARIDSFPTDDPDNWLYAKDVVEFATRHGYHDPTSGVPFSWRDAFHPDPSPGKVRACATREWSVLRRAAPSLNLTSDYHRSVPGAEPYPLFVEVDEKLSLQDVMGLMRDHFEGTELDMTKSLISGTWGAPMRFRGLSFQIDGIDYMWERAISTQQAGFVMVAQCRDWLPDAVGGIYWYTPDDAYTSCFTPLYCGMTRLPTSFSTGTYDRFSWDSMWWVTNFVSNLTYDRWSRLIPEVLEQQRTHEEQLLTTLPYIDRTAAALLEQDEAAARRFLTDWAVGVGDNLFDSWREFGIDLMTRHVDGYVRDESGRSTGPGYPEHWVRRVLAEEGDRLRLRTEGSR